MHGGEGCNSTRLAPLAIVLTTRVFLLHVQLCGLTVVKEPMKDMLRASGGNRFIIKPAVAQAQSANIESIAFWFYVPADVASYTIQLFTYDDYTPVADSAHYKMPFGETYDGTTDGGWHYVNCGTTEGFRKNFAIRVANCASQTIIDYVTYF